jgi:hypothetical protein
MKTVEVELGLKTKIKILIFMVGAVRSRSRNFQSNSLHVSVHKVRKCRQSKVQPPGSLPIAPRGMKEKGRKKMKDGESGDVKLQRGSKVLKS